MAKTRTFVAVNALDDVHVAALKAIDSLREPDDKVKWVEPDNLHWTLQFLGDLNDQEIADVCIRVSRVACDYKPFALAALGVGAFPTAERARTLWLGADMGASELSELQSDIEQNLADLGFRAERRQFVPHLTLGRVGRAAHRESSLADRIARLADFDGGQMPVDAVTVYASELQKSGPRYHVLARAPLG